jgi:hypothetical protein
MKSKEKEKRKVKKKRRGESEAVQIGNRKSAGSFSSTLMQPSSKVRLSDSSNWWLRLSALVVRVHSKHRTEKKEFIRPCTVCLHGVRHLPMFYSPYSFDYFCTCFASVLQNCDDSLSLVPIATSFGRGLHKRGRPRHSCMGEKKKKRRKSGGNQPAPDNVPRYCFFSLSLSGDAPCIISRREGAQFVAFL